MATGCRPDSEPAYWSRRVARDVEWDGQYASPWQAWNVGGSYYVNTLLQDKEKLIML